MSLVINLPTSVFAIKITEANAGVYTRSSGFMKIYKNGVRVTIPLRVTAGDYLTFGGNTGTTIILQ